MSFAEDFFQEWDKSLKDPNNYYMDSSSESSLPDIDISGLVREIKYYGVAAGHLRRITKELKQNNISASQIQNAFLRAYDRLKSETNGIQYTKKALNVYTKYDLSSGNQVLISRYKTYNDEKGKDFYKFNMTLKHFDRFIIEEAVKEGIPEPLITEIVQSDNKKASQKLAKRFSVQLLDEDQDKQEFQIYM